MAAAHKSPIAKGKKASSSHNVIDFIEMRQRGCGRSFNIDSYRVEMMKPKLEEKRIQIDDVHKAVLCSEWIDHRTIIFGSGCGKVMLYDVDNRTVEEAPTQLRAEYNISISSIAINPSKNWVTICKENRLSKRRRITVYNLPNFDRVCEDLCKSDTLAQYPLLYKNHSLCWLDDLIYIETDKTAQIQLYNMNNKNEETKKFDQMSRFGSKYATQMANSAVDSNKKGFCIASLNCCVSFCDANKLEEVTHYYIGEETFTQHINVVFNESRNVFVTATDDNVFILEKDNGCVKTVKLPTQVNTQERLPICSLQCMGDLLTVGTQSGELYKVDLRKIDEKEYLPKHISINYDILTHSFDPSGTRLFIGGGPDTYEYDGYYAAFWQ